ncbi:MAG: MBOAT family protein [Ruminococcaceae bacterium]|nr:MBOAT family protein [Oscillospiraceae bacterium]
MVFSTPVFLFLFLPLTLLIYYVSPKKGKNLIILLSGLLFYSWGEPIYVVVMLISTMIDYFAGLIMNKYEGRKTPRTICLIVSLVMNLGLLGVFKYSGFIAENINAIAGQQIVDITNMNFFGIDFLPMNMLPIGISFFTFQSMSYTIDLYMGNVKVQKNPISFAAFVTLFPQIVAGPIVRYDDVARELDDRSITIDLIYDGIIKFIIGLAKKVLIANSIGSLWTAVKAMEMGSVSVLTSWLGILAFTFQIYFDFSGYSDMAIGLGKMMGFNFPQNFDYPYLSKSISEFWRRWHITLGSWFKSYVYFPLGGSRKGTGRTVFNLAVVWFLTGVWHGASWNFILWGSLYGVIIILEKLFLGKVLDKLPAAIRMIYTMFFVILGWVLFDTADLAAAGSYIATMFGASGILVDSTALYYLATYGITFIICIIGCTDIPKKTVEFIRTKSALVINYAGVIVTMGLFILCTAYLVDQTYNPFLYFNF